MTKPLTVVHDRATGSYCILEGERHVARASYIFHGDAVAMREVREDLQRVVDGYNEALALRAALEEMRTRLLNGRLSFSPIERSNLIAFIDGVLEVQR